MLVIIKKVRARDAAGRHGRACGRADTMSLENGSSSVAVEHGATPAAARTREASASARSTTAGRPAAAAPPYGAETSETAATFTPLIDIHEGPDGLVLVADIPGASESDVQIEVEDNVLSLRAHVTPSAPEGSRLLHQEFHTGDFQRSFILSDEVDREAISAEFKDGVLTLRLPRAARAKTRRIEIQKQG